MGSAPTEPLPLVTCSCCERSISCKRVKDGTIYRPFAWLFSDNSRPYVGLSEARDEDSDNYQPMVSVRILGVPFDCLRIADIIEACGEPPIGMGHDGRGALIFRFRNGRTGALMMLPDDERVAGCPVWP